MDTFYAKNNTFLGAQGTDSWTKKLPTLVQRPKGDTGFLMTRSSTESQEMTVLTMKKKKKKKK